MLYSDGVLSDPSGTIVIKPCKQSEIDFYNSTLAHPQFLPHIPTYMGWIQLNQEATAAAQAAGTLILPGQTEPNSSAGSRIADAPLIEKEWTPSNGEKIQTDMAVVLENVATGYIKPNILDVKLGARLWADDAPLAKRVKLDKIAEETTSKPLGLRIAGMKTFQGLDNTIQEGTTADGYKLYDKMYGRSFSTETVPEGFREYFRLNNEERPKAPMRKVIRRFIDDLEEMAKVIKNEESRMYSASLLFVYEGDPQALKEAFSVEKELIEALHEEHPIQIDNHEDHESGESEEEDRPKFPPIQSLKLIDFAHAQWTPGQGPDENILHGIMNVIKILNDLVS